MVQVALRICVLPLALAAAVLAGCEGDCDWASECAAMEGGFEPDDGAYHSRASICGVRGGRGGAFIGGEHTEEVTWWRNYSDAHGDDGMCWCDLDARIRTDCRFSSVEDCAVWTDEASCERNRRRSFCYWSEGTCLYSGLR